MPRRPSAHALGTAPPSLSACVLPLPFPDFGSDFSPVFGSLPRDWQGLGGEACRQLGPGGCRRPASQAQQKPRGRSPPCMLPLWWSLLLWASLSCDARDPPAALHSRWAGSLGPRLSGGCRRSSGSRLLRFVPVLSTAGRSLSSSRAGGQEVSRVLRGELWASGRRGMMTCWGPLLGARLPCSFLAGERPQHRCCLWSAGLRPGLSPVRFCPGSPGLGD